MTEVWCKFCYARENEIQIRLYSPPPKKKSTKHTCGLWSGDIPWMKRMATHPGCYCSPSCSGSVTA